MKTIGLMIGSFDPIHNGHLALAERAKKEAGLDEVVLLPVRSPDDRTPVATPAQRLEMARLAVKDMPGLSVSDAAISDEQPPDEARLLACIAQAHGLVRCALIFGADSLSRFAQTPDAPAIAGQCELIYASRDVVGRTREKETVRTLSRMGARVKSMRMRPLDISAAAVRDALRRGKPVKRALPDSVAAYIRAQGLYAPPPEDILPGMMDEKRWQHTLGVRDTALRLAALYGVDGEKARLAALMHDSAKCMPYADMLRLTEQNNLPVDSITRSRRALLHGPVGAYLAQSRFHIADEDVLNAIRYHTTGRADMSELEIIIYLADAIEPTRRDYPGLSDIRRMADTDLWRAALMSMQRSVEYVTEGGGLLAPATADAIQWLGGRIIRRDQAATRP